MFYPYSSLGGPGRLNLIGDVISVIHLASCRNRPRPGKRVENDVTRLAKVSEPFLYYASILLPFEIILRVIVVVDIGIYNCRVAFVIAFCEPKAGRCPVFKAVVKKGRCLLCIDHIK